MTDTATPVLNFALQTVGANRNTWGGINNNNLTLIEEAICGRLSLSTTGGSTVLTQAQARNYFIAISGSLSSDATIVVPNKSKSWKFINNTSGGFGLLVKTADGAATSVPPGTTKDLFCSGNDGVFRSDSDDVGMMAFFGNSSVPNGWLECDSATLSRDGLGRDLFAKIGTTWGVGNGVTTFNKPDAYTAGKFLRSRTASVALATAQTDANKAHTHALTAASAASGGSHTHTGTTDAGGGFTPSGTNAASAVTFSGAPSGFWVVQVGGTQINGSGSGMQIGLVTATAAAQTFTGNAVAAHTHTFTTASGGAHTHTLSGTTDSDGGTEARPTNLSAILCIKF